MKRFLAITIITIIVIGCGAPQGTGGGKGKFDIYARLTEGELTNFIRAFPVFVEEARKHGKALEKFEGKNPLSAMGDYSQFVARYKDLEATVKAKTGQSIEDIFSAYFKVVFAYGAMAIKEGMPKYGEAIAELEAKLKDPNIPSKQREMLTEQLKMYQQVKTSTDSLYQNVPSENVELVRKYKKEIEAIFENIE